MRKDLLTKCTGILIAAAVAAMTVPPAHALDKIHVVTSRNSVFVLSYMGARDAGVFRKHGIDLSVDARPFAGFLAAIPSKEAMVGQASGLGVISHINNGMDLVVMGGGLTVMNSLFALTSSDIHKITDLKGKKLGTWSTGASAYAALRTTALDGYNFDVAHDDQLLQIGPPALFKLLQRGDVNAMINISSLTVAAYSQPEKFRMVFSPNEYWEKKTGYPLVWTSPVVAWRSWVDANRDRARRFVEAMHDSYRWLRDPANLHAAVKKYGVLAGVKPGIAENTYARLLKEKRIFLDHWTKPVVDAEWKFLEAAKKLGVLKKVPPEDKYGLILTK